MPTLKCALEVKTSIRAFSPLRALNLHQDDPESVFNPFPCQFGFGNALSFFLQIRFWFWNAQCSFPCQFRFRFWNAVSVHTVYIVATLIMLPCHVSLKSQLFILMLVPEWLRQDFLLTKLSFGQLEHYYDGRSHSKHKSDIYTIIHQLEIILSKLFQSYVLSPPETHIF